MVVKPMFILYHKLVVNIFYFFPKTWFLSKGNIDEAGLEPGGATKYLKFITFQYLKLFEKKIFKNLLRHVISDPRICCFQIASIFTIPPSLNNQEIKVIFVIFPVS